MNSDTVPVINERDMADALRVICTTPWRPATSKAWEKYPHEYIIKGKTVPEDKFYTLWEIIRQNHVRRFKFNRQYPYLTIHNYTYWINVDRNSDFYPKHTYTIINRVMSDE